MTPKSSMVPYGQHVKESALVAPESTLVGAVQILAAAKSIVMLMGGTYGAYAAGGDHDVTYGLNQGGLFFFRTNPKKELCTRTSAIALGLKTRFTERVVRSLLPAD